MMSVLTLHDHELMRVRHDSRTILTGLRVDSPWSDEPGVEMWDGYEDALILYSDFVVREMWRRQIPNRVPTLLYKTEDKLYANPTMDMFEIVKPDWTSDPDVNERDKKELKARDPVHYGYIYDVKDGLRKYLVNNIMPVDKSGSKKDGKDGDGDSVKKQSDLFAFSEGVHGPVPRRKNAVARNKSRAGY